MSSDPSLDNFPTICSELGRKRGKVFHLAHTFNPQEHSGMCLNYKLAGQEVVPHSFLQGGKPFQPQLTAWGWDAAGAHTCPAEEQRLQNAEVAASCCVRLTETLQEFHGRCLNSITLKFPFLDASTQRKIMEVLSQGSSLPQLTLQITKPFLTL